MVSGLPTGKPPPFPSRQRRVKKMGHRRAPKKLLQRTRASPRERALHQIVDRPNDMKR